MVTESQFVQACAPVDDPITRHTQRYTLRGNLQQPTLESEHSRTLAVSLERIDIFGDRLTTSRIRVVLDMGGHQFILLHICYFAVKHTN